MTTEMTSESSQDAGTGTSPGSGKKQSSSSPGTLRHSANDTMSKVGDTGRQAAQQAAEAVRETASSLASDARGRMKGLMGDKMAAGADLIGHLASSTKRAAEDLDPNAPQISGLLRDAGVHMEEFSRTIRDKPIDELIQTASNYARRQPAILFGAAALIGFALLRTFKSAPLTDQGSMTGGLTPRGEPEGGIHDAPSILSQG